LEAALEKNTPCICTLYTTSQATAKQIFSWWLVVRLKWRCQKCMLSHSFHKSNYHLNQQKNCPPSALLAVPPQVSSNTFTASVSPCRTESQCCLSCSRERFRFKPIGGVFFFLGVVLRQLSQKFLLLLPVPEFSCCFWGYPWLVLQAFIGSFECDRPPLLWA